MASDSFCWPRRELPRARALPRPRDLGGAGACGGFLTAWPPGRALIEGGAPEALVQSFHDLFHEKVISTKEFAKKAAEQYGFLPLFLRDS